MYTWNYDKLVNIGSLTVRGQPASGVEEGDIAP